MLKGAAAKTVADTTRESEDTMSNRIDPSELNRNRVFLSFLSANNELTDAAQNTESTIEELVIYDKSSPAVGQRQAYNTRRAKFRLISDAPLPPPSNKYQTILINAEILQKITDYNKNLENDLLRINTTFYKNYLTRRRQEQAIAKFQARATNLLFLAGGYACFYGSVYLKGASVIKYLITNNLLTKGGWAPTLFRGSLELFFNLQPAQLRVFDKALAELISATENAVKQINGPPVDLYYMAFNGIDIFSEKIKDVDLGKGMKNGRYSGGSQENNMAIGHYQKTVIGFFNTLTDIVSPNGLISHCLKTMGKDFKIKPIDTRKVEPSLVDQLFTLDTREIKLQLLMITLRMDRSDADTLLARVETFSNTYEGLKWATEVYRDYQMEISNVKALIYDDTYSDTGFRLKHVNNFMSRFQQNSTFRNAFKNSFTLFDNDTRFFGMAADPSDKTYTGQILLFYDSFNPHNFMGFMSGLVYDEVTRTVTTSIQTLSSRIFEPVQVAGDADADDNNSTAGKKRREMETYKEMVHATTLLRLKSGASMEATLVEINKLKIVSHPDYVFDGKDVTALENIWYYFTTKTAKLHNEGKFTNAIYWTGAATCGLMLGNIFTYDSGNMFNNDSASWANLVSFFGEPWYELLQNILSGSGLGNWRLILQNYRDGLGTLYDQTYDAYIRKPLMGMSFMKQWRKWQGNAKSWAAFSKRWYFSVYINYVLGGLIDKFFNILTMALTEGPAQQIMALDWHLGGEGPLSAQVFPRLITNAHVSWLMSQLPKISVRSIWGGMAKTFHSINDPAGIWDLSNGINIVGGIVQSTGKSVYENIHVSYESPAQGFEEALPTHSAMFNKWMADAIESALKTPEVPEAPGTPPLAQDGTWARWLHIAARENLQAAKSQVARITGIPSYIAEQTKKELARRLLHSVAEAQQRLFFNMVPHGTRTTQRTFWLKLDNGGYIELDSADTKAYKKAVDRVEFISFVAQHWLQNGLPSDIDPYTYLMGLAPGISRDVTEANAAEILAAARVKYTKYFNEAARSPNRDALTDFIGEDIATDVSAHASIYKTTYLRRLGGKTATQLYNFFFNGGDSYISIGDTPALYYKIRKATEADTNDRYKLPDGRFMEQIHEIPGDALYIPYAHTTEFFDSYGTGLYGNAYIKSTDTPPDHYLIGGYNTNYIFGGSKSYFYKSLAKASDVYYQRFVISAIHHLYAQNPDAADDDDDDEDDPSKKRAKSIFEEHILAATKKNPRLAEDLHTILANGNTIAGLLFKINRTLDNLPDDTRTRAQIEKYIQSGGRDGSLIDAIYDDVVELESLKSTRDRLIDQVMNRFKGSEVVKHERARNLKNVKDRLVVEKQRVADALALLPPDDDDNDDDDDDKPKISAAAVSILRNMVDDLTFTDINKGRFIDIVGILEGGDIGFSSLKNIRTRLNELLHDIDENEDELDMHIHDIYSTGIPYAQIDGIEAEVRILSGEADRLTKAHAVWVSGRDKYNEHNAEITSWWSSEIKRRIPTMWAQDEKSIDEQLAAAEIAYNAIDHKTPAGIAEYERLVTALRKLKRSAPDVGMNDADELRLLYTESESSHKNVSTAISALDIFLRGLSGAPGRRAFVNFLRDQMSQPSSGIIRVDSLEALGAGFLKARPDDSKPMNDRITAFNDKITLHNTALTATDGLLKGITAEPADVNESEFMALWAAYTGLDKNLGAEVANFSTERATWETNIIKAERERIIASVKADLIRVEQTYKAHYESLDTEIGELDLVIQQAHLLSGTEAAGYIQNLTLTRDILVSIREKYEFLTTGMGQHIWIVENGDNNLILRVMEDSTDFSGLETQLSDVIALRSNYGDTGKKTTRDLLISAITNFYNDPAMATHKDKHMGTLYKDIATHGLGIWNHLLNIYVPETALSKEPTDLQKALSRHYYTFKGNLSGRRDELVRSVTELYNNPLFSANKDTLLSTIESDIDTHGSNIWSYLIDKFKTEEGNPGIDKRNAVRTAQTAWIGFEKTLPLLSDTSRPKLLHDDHVFRLVYQAVEDILRAQQALANSHLEELNIMALHALQPPRTPTGRDPVGANSGDGDKKPSPMDNLKILRAFFAKPENNVPEANAAIVDIDSIIATTFNVPQITLPDGRYGNVRKMIQTILNIQILRTAADEHPFHKNPANLPLLSTMNTQLGYLSKLKQEIEARGTEYASQSLLLKNATERMSAMQIKWINAPGYGDPNFFTEMAVRRDALESQLIKVIAGTRRPDGPYVVAFDIKSAISTFDRDLTDFDTALDEEIEIRNIVDDLNRYAAIAEERASSAEESAGNIGKFNTIAALSESVADQLRTAASRIGGRKDPRITAAYDRIDAAHLRTLSVERHIARSRAVDARSRANYWAGLAQTGPTDLPGLKTALVGAEAAMVNAYAALTAGRDTIRDLQNPKTLEGLERLRAAEEKFANTLTPSWINARDTYNDLVARIYDIEHPEMGASWASAAVLAETLANEADAALAAARAAASAGALLAANSGKSDIEARWTALRDRIDDAQRGVEERIAAATRDIVIKEGPSAEAHAAAARDAAKKARRAFSSTHRPVVAPETEPLVWYDETGMGQEQHDDTDEGEEIDLDKQDWQTDYDRLIAEIDALGIAALANAWTLAQDKVYQLDTDIAAHEVALDPEGKIRIGYENLRFNREAANRETAALKAVADAAEAKYQEMKISLADRLQEWVARLFGNDATAKLKWYEDERDRAKAAYEKAKEKSTNLDKETPIDVQYKALQSNPDFERLRAELAAAKEREKAAKKAYDDAKKAAQGIVTRNNSIFDRQSWENDTDYETRKKSDDAHVDPPRTLTKAERAELEEFITHVQSGRAIKGSGKGSIRARFKLISPAVKRLVGKSKNTSLTDEELAAAVTQKLEQIQNLETSLTDAQAQLLSEYLRLHAALAASQALHTRLTDRLSVITTLDQEIGEEIRTVQPPEDIELEPHKNVFDGANSRITPFLEARLKAPKFGLPTNWRERMVVVSSTSAGFIDVETTDRDGWIHADGTIRDEEAGPPTCSEATYNMAYDGVCKVVPQKDPYDFSDFENTAWWGNKPDINKKTFQDRFFSELTMHDILTNDKLGFDINSLPDKATRDAYKAALYTCGTDASKCDTFVSDARWSNQTNRAAHDKIRDLYTTAINTYNGGTVMSSDILLARYITNAIFGAYDTLPVRAVGRSNAGGKGISVGIAERLEAFFGRQGKKITMRDVFYHDGMVAGGAAIQGVGIVVTAAGQFIKSVVELFTGGLSTWAEITGGMTALSAYQIKKAVEKDLQELRANYAKKLPIRVFGSNTPGKSGGPGETRMLSYDDNPAMYDAAFRSNQLMYQTSIVVLRIIQGGGTLIAAPAAGIVAGKAIIGAGAEVKRWGVAPVMAAHNTNEAGAKEALGEVRGEFFAWFRNRHVQDIEVGLGQSQRQIALFKGVETELQALFIKHKGRLSKGATALAKYTVEVPIECDNPSEAKDKFWEDCRFSLFPGELPAMIEFLLSSELAEQELAGGPKQGGSLAVAEDHELSDIEMANKKLLFYVFISKIHYFEYEIDHEIINNMIWREFEIRLRTLIYIRDCADILGVEPNLVYIFPLIQKISWMDDRITRLYFDKDSFEDIVPCLPPLSSKFLEDDAADSETSSVASEASAGSTGSEASAGSAGSEASAGAGATFSRGGKRKQTRKTRRKRLVLRSTLKR